MITQCTSGGPFSPRSIVFKPSDDGIRFTTGHSTLLNDVVYNDIHENECPFNDSLSVGKEKEEEDTLENNNEEKDEEEENNEDVKTINMPEIIEDLFMKQELLEGYKKSTFMIKYLNAFTKATQISKELSLFFTDESDKGFAILHYTIEKGVITFCLSNIDQK